MNSKLIPTSIGVFLFTSVIGTHIIRRYLRTSKIPSDIPSKISKMENLIQLDEGGRGIKEICLPLGELQKSAEVLLKSRHVIIITGLLRDGMRNPAHFILGFPCLLDFTPPTETDGPLGCMAIARCCLALGKRVTIVTDEVNEDVIIETAAASNLHSIFSVSPDQPPPFSLHSFPPMDSFEEEDFRRLEELQQDANVVIAIERAGPSISGKYLTMRGRDMSGIVAPLDLLLKKTNENNGDVDNTFLSIGIGDGGNEVGMGKIYDQIIKSQIPNASQIACIVPSDYLIVSSVSNWGGYALSAATALLASQPENSLISKRNILNCLPTDQEETNICKRMVNAGARDGVTAKQELSIDGMPLLKSLEVLQKLREILIF